MSDSPAGMIVGSAIFILLFFAILTGLVWLIIGIVQGDLWIKIICGAVLAGLALLIYIGSVKRRAAN